MELSNPARRIAQTVLWLLFAAAVCLCALFALGVIGVQSAERVSKKEFNIGYSSYIYTGYIQSGKFNGKGEVFFSDGSSYKGGFIDGRFNGAGVFTSVEGWRYEGSFSSGKMTGEGTFYYE